MTPLLTLLFGINPTVAVGTDLAFASHTKGVGTIAHRLNGTVRRDVVKLHCIGASVLLTVVAIIFRVRMQAWINAHPARQLHGKKLAAATIFCGALLGALVTISSFGAGAIGATLLVLLYPRLSPAEIAGTDIAYAVPLTAIAAIGHWWLGSINWELLGMLLLGSVPGITLGSLAAAAVPEKMLRLLLAGTLTGVAAKLVL